MNFIFFAIFRQKKLSKEVVICECLSEDDNKIPIRNHENVNGFLSQCCCLSNQISQGMTNISVLGLI